MRGDFRRKRRDWRTAHGSLMRWSEGLSSVRFVMRVRIAGGRCAR